MKLEPVTRMTPSEALGVIDKIAATASKNDKEMILAGALDDGFFRSIIIRALDGFRTYGVAKIPPAIDGTHDQQFDQATFQLLDELEVRDLTGNAAKTALQKEFARLDETSGELFKRVLLKDLRAGFSESTVNKAWPGLVPTFDCMLAHPFEEKRAKAWPMIAEPKLDGVRVLTFVNFDEGTVKFFSRSGKEFTTFDHLKQPVLRMVEGYRGVLVAKACDEAEKAGIPDGDEMSPADMSAMDDLLAKHGADGLAPVFDSEVVSGTFNKTVGDVRRKDEQAGDARLYLFDVLPMAAFQRDDKDGYAPAGDYTRRRTLLNEIYQHAEKDGPLILMPAFSVASVEQIHHLYDKVREKGIEGLIIKDPKALYHRRRNHGWMKIKAEESVDVKVVDLIEGEGKYVGMLGAAVVEYKGMRVNVGSGITDEQRKSWWGAKAEIIGRLMEVQFHEVTPDGSLRHPRFVRFRDDKPLEEAA